MKKVLSSNTETLRRSPTDQQIDIAGYRIACTRLKSDVTNHTTARMLDLPQSSFPMARSLTSLLDHKVRVVGLSTALANARDLADWLAIKNVGLYNFRPSVRPVPLQVHIKGFHGKHYCPRMASISKPAFQVGRCNTAKTIAQEWPAFQRYLCATCWPDCEKGRTD